MHKNPRSTDKKQEPRMIRRLKKSMKHDLAKNILNCMWGFSSKFQPRTSHDAIYYYYTNLLLFILVQS